MLNWTEEYAVGVEELDRQHREIVTLLNEWAERTELTSATAEFAELLSVTLEKITSHLKYEEALLRKHGYPDIEHHVELHNKLLDTIEDVSIEVASTSRGSALPIVDCLSREWWKHHILEEDMKYRAFFEEKGIA